MFLQGAEGWSPAGVAVGGNGQTRAQLALRDPNIRVMLRIRDDDPAAFAELVALYQRRLVSVLRQLVDNQEEAEDLARGVFLRVYRVRKTYRPRARFSTWLFTNAKDQAPPPVPQPVQPQAPEDLPRHVGSLVWCSDGPGAAPERNLLKPAWFNVLQLGGAHHPIDPAHLR
jgi:hypothetical protein